MKTIWTEPGYYVTHISIFCSFSSCLLACSAFRCLNHPAAYLGVQAQYRALFFAHASIKPSAELFAVLLSMFPKIEPGVVGLGR